MLIMIVMVFTYMAAELVVGLVGNSLTLVGDAFHMLSDSTSMIVGIISINLAKRQANGILTFGY